MSRRNLFCALGVMIASCFVSEIAHAQEPLFEILRGDANDSGSVSVADAFYINAYLFSGGDDPSCVDAADANDDGSITSADVTFLFDFLFYGGEDPPPPYPSCGDDPTEDSLRCDESQCES